MAVYLKPEDLYFELVVCKGKGKASEKLSEYFYLIADNLKNKAAFFITDFHDDQVQEAYCMMMESWRLVDCDKYNPAGVFAYFTERGKRSYTKIYNIYLDRQSRTNYETIPKVSLSNFDYS